MAWEQGCCYGMLVTLPPVRMEERYLQRKEKVWLVRVQVSLPSVQPSVYGSLANFQWVLSRNFQD